MELILSILTGGATGLIGSLVGKVFGFLQVREERKNRLAEYAHIERLHELNTQARGVELEAEAAIAATQAEAQMRSEAYRHDTAIGQGGPVLTFILRMVRPVLTFGLVGLVAYFWIDTDANSDLIDANAFKAKLIDTVVYLASAAVLFWFGSRGTTMVRSK